MTGQIKKKTLLVLKLTDGVFVLTPKEEHAPKRRYQHEAVGFFGKLLRKRLPIVACIKHAAHQNLADIVGFRNFDAIDNLPEFQRNNIEWHPVVLKLDVYFLDRTFLEHVRKRERANVIPLSEHEFADKITALMGNPL